jgi:antirestriction protein ArdC
MTNNAYDKITERILELMEKGTCPWKQPWSTRIAPPQNFCTGRHYSGMNFFMLSMSGYQSPYFMTFKQVQEHGGSVKKGSHGFPVVYWGTTEIDGKEAPAESAERPTGADGKPKLIPFLRSYTVFNAEQIEDVKFPPLAEPSERPFNPIERAEEVVKEWKDAPETLHGYPKAYYRADTDKIYLPNPQDFEKPERYYETRFHEMGHATGAEHRLNRKLGGRPGSEQYSREELVAEMTSAFLCAKCGIDNEVIESQASYIEGWMKAIKDDHRLIVTAASQAQRAANYIQGITYEIPTKERAEQLARTLEVRQKIQEIAEAKRPDYGREESKTPEIEIGMGR